MIDIELSPIEKAMLTEIKESIHPDQLVMINRIIDRLKEVAYRKALEDLIDDYRFRFKKEFEVER